MRPCQICQNWATRGNGAKMLTPPQQMRCNASKPKGKRLNDKLMRAGFEEADEAIFGGVMLVPRCLIVLKLPSKKAAAKGGAKAASSRLRTTRTPTTSRLRPTRPTRQMSEFRWWPGGGPVVAPPKLGDNGLAMIFMFYPSPLPATHKPQNGPKPDNTGHRTVSVVFRSISLRGSQPNSPVASKQFHPLLRSHPIPTASP